MGGPTKGSTRGPRGLKMNAITNTDKNRPQANLSQEYLVFAWILITKLNWNWVQRWKQARVGPKTLLLPTHRPTEWRSARARRARNLHLNWIHSRTKTTNHKHVDFSKSICPNRKTYLSKFQMYFNEKERNPGQTRCVLALRIQSCLSLLWAYAVMVNK